MKSIISFLRPFVFAPFILYVFDLMAVILKIYIPLNIITVIIVGLLEIPGLLMLIVIDFMIV